MAKVSIGLRGWRFNEETVMNPDGTIKPIGEMPDDVGERISRLTALVGSPCDACWLIHGDENLTQCEVAEVVYGEPLAEVVLCGDHESDFLYWFREVGGRDYMGSDELQDAFYEWFADGGRAPEGYASLEHVETDPEDLPEPPDPDETNLVVDVEMEDPERIDLREVEVEEKEKEQVDQDDLDEADVDLDVDYPG